MVKALADDPRPPKSRSLTPPAGVDLGDLELRRLRMGPEKAGLLRWEDVEAEWGDDEAV